MRKNEGRSVLQSEDLFEPSGAASGKQGLPDAFKRIYYHLYTNSRASRAELIVEDLSLLLLVSLSAEISSERAALSAYLNGKGTANKTLVPILRQAFPELGATKQAFTLGDDSLRMALGELAELDLAHAPAHTLGEAFQALIGPRLRGEKGQFFTPKSLVRAMVEIVDPQPGEAIADPACGTGGFLAEAHIYQLRKHASAKLSGALVGVDKDSGLARLASALLKILSRGRAHVYDFNSLSLSEWAEHTGKPIIGSYDVVLTNPPFGSKIGLKDQSTLESFAFGHIWSQNNARQPWVQTGALAASADPQILFLELCVRALRAGGRMGIVLPEGVFGNKQTAYVWDWLEGQGEVFALLDCPRTTFQPGTDTKTNVLFFKKGESKHPARTPSLTRIAVALHCGHDRRGRSYLANGDPQPDDFQPIATSFRDAKRHPDRWRTAKLQGERYLVPRYYFGRDEILPGEQEIANGARFATLGELVKERAIRIRKGHEVGSQVYGTGEIPFVRTSDLANFEISSDPTKSVSEQVFAEVGAQQNLRPGDILMVVDGRYRIGTTAMLTEHSARCVVQSHLRIISTLKPKVLDPYELLYALNLPSVRLRVRSLVFIQSTLGTLGNRLLELRVPLLHGDGPWAIRVARFRDALQRRSALLSDLNAMSGPDYEL